MNGPTVSLTFRAPTDEAERLRKLAESEDRPLSSLLRRGVAAVLAERDGNE